jgi:unsaturated rhamnogalacturonyl hydrolase
MHTNGNLRQTNALALARRIGDKLIRDTPFRYRLEVASNHRVFDRMHFVDFGRTFGLERPAVAYAWTQLTVTEAEELAVQVEHNDGCKIWLNGAVVYGNSGERKINLHFDERSIEMSHALTLSLKRGANTLLIKSETRGGEWRVYLQPPSAKGAVVNGVQHAEIGLRGVPDVDEKISALTNWLVIGPFENARHDLDEVHAPEKEFVFGQMYPGLGAPVTWTIPKIEILGAMIDPAPWGTNYQWNYHNGGTAWAMQILAAASGEKKYADYANQFCDYHLEGIPFVRHQVKTLNRLDSANHFIIDTPLLDFTLAPSLPFIHRLRMEKQFPHREHYAEWIARILKYAREEQIRLPGHGIFTRTTPVKYTTWVDDMFMGIPFLVQAALHAKDEVARKFFFDDAAHQVLEFNSQVWDAEANLYMHARFSDNPVKLPHWSRCNGWAIWAMSEVLLHLPPNHGNYSAIRAQFRQHAAALAKLQAADGFWFNVLDRPDSAKEVSGTAIFVMAMARGVRHGWLAAEQFEPVVRRGWAALETQIEADGTVHGICMGTMCTEEVNYYIERPFYDNDTHGLFAVLFAGIEVHSLLHDDAGRNGGAKNSVNGAAEKIVEHVLPPSERIAI